MLLVQRGYMSYEKRWELGTIPSLTFSRANKRVKRGTIYYLDNTIQSLTFSRANKRVKSGTFESLK